VAFSLGDQVGPSDAGQLATDDLLGIVNIHAASFRREFVATILDRRVYLLLPNLESADAAVGPVRQAVTAARHHLNAAAQAAIGPVVDSITAAAESRRGADEALAVAENHSVVTFDTLRAVLAVDVAAQALAGRPELSEPALERLIADERDLARTLLKHLESGSDVGRVAELLHIHPTTVRYRLRRASELLDIDLDEPDRRLALHLELRAALRGSQSGA
jgi:DNA-binding PucR family transcriptional regulator